MDTFSIIRNALAQSEDDPQKAGLDADTILAGRVLAAVQSVVDALTPPDGGRYIVTFENINTAGTNLFEHKVRVSTKPLRDPRLTLVERRVSEEAARGLPRLIAFVNRTQPIYQLRLADAVDLLDAERERRNQCVTASASAISD